MPSNRPTASIKITGTYDSIIGGFGSCSVSFENYQKNEQKSMSAFGALRSGKE
jgi:hypothetical protein